jgi:hypothetical protein
MATVALPTVLSATTSAKGNAADDAKFEPRDFDLTYTIAQYLDRHMVLPLIEFLQEKSVGLLRTCKARASRGAIRASCISHTTRLSPLPR